MCFGNVQHLLHFLTRNSNLELHLFPAGHNCQKYIFHPNEAWTCSPKNDLNRNWRSKNGNIIDGRCHTQNYLLLKNAFLPQAPDLNWVKRNILVQHVGQYCSLVIIRAHYISRSLLKLLFLSLYCIHHGVIRFNQDSCLELAWAK